MRDVSKAAILEAVEKLFRATTEGFGKLDGRMDGLDRRMSVLEGCMGRLEARMDGLERSMTNLEVGLDQVFARIDDRLKGPIWQNGSDPVS